MARRLTDLRSVYVVGIGLHPYQAPSETSYIALGLRAIREALADAALAWGEVEASYVGVGRLGMACGNSMLRHLGAQGRPLVHIENASASGSAAFRHACIEVAAGVSDVVLAVGVDKPTDRARLAQFAGGNSLAPNAITGAAHFALIASEYMQSHGLTREDLALVSVKNHRNGALNPFAQRPIAFTLEDVLASSPIASPFTSLQCTPIGEGAAAVVIASEEAIRRSDLDAGRAVRVVAAAANSGWGGVREHHDLEIAAAGIHAALHEAQIEPDALDVVELHEAFTIEELQYVEAAGLCPKGQYMHWLKDGAFDLNGRCAVSASGGLLSMGHPVGPTGLGQIAEITRQLRGEAGPRQHRGARIGLAHMVGLGGVGYAHVLSI